MAKILPSLSILPFFIKACSLAILNNKIVNTNTKGDVVDDYGYIKEYVIRNDHNFNVGMNTK